MAGLFDSFPLLESNRLIIKKITENDIESLVEITHNENVYRYIPPFLYKKSRGNLLAAIRNLGGRDFEKRKMIIAGVYRKNEPNKLVGLAEMFDYKKHAGTITIGYRINESFWHQGIATEVVSLIVEYLAEEIGIPTIQAFVMPENAYSSKALLRNGFKKEDYLVPEKNWGGNEIVDVEVYTYKKK